MNASLVVNPVAGRRRHRVIREIEKLIREKVSCTTFITRGKGDAFAFAKDAADTDIIIVAGGDGTFNEVLNGLLSPENNFSEKINIPLALIPLGTTNVLAKELGIPHNVEKAVHLALTGAPKKISLGRINGRYFSLMAGIGFDGEAVLKANNRIKRFLGKGAYIYSGLKTLAGYRPPLIQVKISKETFTGFNVVAGNARCYGGNFKVNPKADITEPLIDVCLLKSKSRKRLLRFIAGVVFKRHLNFRDVVYRKTARVEITSKDTVHVQIDGDYFGTLPVSIDVVKDAVSVVW